VAGFVAWLRLPPEAWDGRVAVLPTAQYHCSAASVNRKLAALTSFWEFHARHGVELVGLLVRMQPAGRRGSATSFKPFLHHVTKSRPERQRAIKLKDSPPRPRILTVKQVQAILDRLRAPAGPPAVRSSAGHRREDRRGPRLAA
jgi:integrase/recombinase XerD